MVLIGKVKDARPGPAEARCANALAAKSMAVASSTVAAAQAQRPMRV